MKGKFSHRSDAKEMMDDLHCGGAELDQTMRELDTINKWLGGHNVTIDAIKKLLGPKPSQAEITIADIGCGGGDQLAHVADWARKNKRQIRMIGIDANPNIIAYAQKNTANYPEITYRKLDIFSDAFKQMRFDIVTATLFTHHFSSEPLAALLHQLRQQARVGVVVNDLHRHWLAFYSIGLLTKAFSKSEMVKHDSMVSVLRAFRHGEWVDILKKAGINQYFLQWRWAFRWLLAYEGNCPT